MKTNLFSRNITEYLFKNYKIILKIFIYINIYIYIWNR